MEPSTVEAQYAQWLGEQEIYRRSPQSPDEPELILPEHSPEVQAAFEAGWDRMLAEVRRWTGRG